MKRILAAAVSLAMLVSLMTVGASATYMDDSNKITSNGAGNNSSAGQAAIGTENESLGIGTVDVKIKNGTAGGTTHVYAVTYDVTELTFTYGDGSGQIWNPETLQYNTLGGSGAWSQNSQNITITNYSDLPIKVTPSFNPTAETGNVTVALGEALALPSAATGMEDGTGEAQKGTISVTVSGAPVGYYATAASIGTITLTVVGNPSDGG